MADVQQREVAPDCGELGKTLIPRLVQRMLVQPLQHYFGKEHVLAQLSCSCDFGMQLAEIRYGLPVEYSTRRTPGMVICRRLVVEVEVLVLEGRQQLLDITLDMEKRD